MHLASTTPGPRRRALALGVLTTALFAALLGLAADRAAAAYSAHVENGVLKVVGDSASDRLTLQLAPGFPGVLEIDVGSDGTADFSFDRSTFTAIEVKGRSGDDEIRVSQIGGAFPDEALTLMGEGGDDTLVGGIGDNTLVGGYGDDVVSGGDGNDTVLLGSGADTVVWNPGDDNDTVDGQTGDDTLDFNGANVGEIVGVAANGSRVRFTRNVANIVMDLADVEHIGFDAFGGADSVVVTDLAGTGAESVDVDLTAFGGAGDGQPDSVVARGADGDDVFEASSSPAGVHMAALAVDIDVTGGEPGGDGLVAEGGAGSDTVRYRGTDGDDVIPVFANGTAAAVAPLGTARIDAAAVESLVLLGLDGADTLSATGNLAALTTITMDGGDGDDILRGGNGADLLLGDDGEDFVDGNQGLDTALLGRGEDTFQWDPGDNSDVVEGQGGADRLDFNGSNIGEIVEVSADGPRVRFTRNIASIAMDIDGVERLAFHALGGADHVVVNDLAGTDTRTVDADLGATGGGGDGAADSVTARGTDGPDDVSLSSPGGFPIVSGLFAEVIVESAEAALDDVNVATLGGADTIRTGREVFGPASYNVDGGDGDDVTRYAGTDQPDTIQVVANGAEVSTLSPLASRLDTFAVESLVLLGLAGPDTITAVGNLAALTSLTLDGGLDGDTILGGNGADLLLGGDGDDHVDGNQGTDVARLGAGDDRFTWDPGDNSDVVEGQAGSDSLEFNGSNIGELVNVLPNGRRAQLTRNIANVTMDFNGVEGVFLHVRGGTDTVEVGDMAGTHVGTVDVDLIGPGGLDGVADMVVVDGTGRRDVIGVTRSGSDVLVDGLRARTRIFGSEPALDTLLLQTMAGDDEVTVAPDVGDLIATIVDLGGDE
jgi:predicted ester cyclase